MRYTTLRYTILLHPEVYPPVYRTSEVYPPVYRTLRLTPEESDVAQREINTGGERWGGIYPGSIGGFTGVWGRN